MDEYLFDDDNRFDDCIEDEDTWIDGEFVTPTTDEWNDVIHTAFKTKISIDEAKTTQWERAKEEIKSVNNRMKSILDLDDVPTEKDVIMYILGPKSDISIFFQQRLKLTVEEYQQFMTLFCIQAAYKVSSSQLFSPSSLIAHALPAGMTEADYNHIWKNLATKKKLKRSGYIGAGRREKCLWEMLEDIVNNLCRDISISNRTGKIGIALDDDKIWVNLTNSNKEDTFGLRYTTHTRPNRKGLIDHTAVSTGASLPLGVVFHRKNDTTFSCFERLLKFLFETNGICDLRNVEVVSDRGYLIPSVVYPFVIKNGGDICGTTQRILNTWPFTFDQKLKDSDNRTLIEKIGPPTLFVKEATKHLKNVQAFAFRNGTNSVTTCLSTIHRNHHWEGVGLKAAEVIEYEQDDKSLRKKCFVRMKSDCFDENELLSEKELINDLLDNKIDPLTLRQGKT